MSAPVPASVFQPVAPRIDFTSKQPLIFESAVSLNIRIAYMNRLESAEKELKQVREENAKLRLDNARNEAICRYALMMLTHLQNDDDDDDGDAPAPFKRRRRVSDAGSDNRCAAAADDADADNKNESN